MNNNSKNMVQIIRKILEENLKEETDLAQINLLEEITRDSYDSLNLFDEFIILNFIIKNVSYLTNASSFPNNEVIFQQYSDISINGPEFLVKKYNLLRHFLPILRLISLTKSIPPSVGGYIKADDLDNIPPEFVKFLSNDFYSIVGRKEIIIEISKIAETFIHINLLKIYQEISENHITISDFGRFEYIEIAAVTAAIGEFVQSKGINVIPRDLNTWLNTFDAVFRKNWPNAVKSNLSLLSIENSIIIDPELYLASICISSCLAYSNHQGEECTKKLEELTNLIQKACKTNERREQLIHSDVDDYFFSNHSPLWPKCLSNIDDLVRMIFWNNLNSENGINNIDKTNCGDIMPIDLDRTDKKSAVVFVPYYRYAPGSLGTRSQDFVNIWQEHPILAWVSTLETKNDPFIADGINRNIYTITPFKFLNAHIKRQELKRQSGIRKTIKEVAVASISAQVMASTGLKLPPIFEGALELFIGVIISNFLNNYNKGEEKSDLW